MPAISKVFFPLSRAWASAVAAQGDVDLFHATVDLGSPRKTVGKRLLDTVDRSWKSYETALSDWEGAFFEGADDAGRLEALDKARQSAARKVMALRAGFLPAHMERPFPAARFNIEGRGSVEERHTARFLQPDAGLSPPNRPDVTESRSFIRDGIRIRWARFPTPHGIEAPPAEARIREPTTAPPRATLVFAHGIGMETEMWGEQGTIPDWFLAQGFRVIEPQGPWHARRRVPGCYGGEPIFARGAGGLLDYSWTHVRELGGWISYARSLPEGDRPVLIAGISLGALTSMQLVSWAGHWPDNALPDYAMLIAPAASLVEVAYRGALTGGMGVPGAMEEAGWSEDTVAAWAPLLDASKTPSLAPSRIIAVLGDVDEITPYESGEELVRRWHLPDDRVFRRNQGHFTVSLGLTAAPEPLQACVEMVLGA